VSATPDALGTLVLPPKVTLSCVPISAAASGRAGGQRGWEGGVCMGVAAEIAFMPATENKNGVSRQTFVLWERGVRVGEGVVEGPRTKSAHCATMSCFRCIVLCARLAATPYTGKITSVE